MTMNKIDFEKAKPILKKYFINFYGEERKELINKKIDSIIPIFPFRMSDVNQNMITELQRKKIELSLRFLKLYGIDLDPDLIELVIKQNGTHSLKEKNPKAYDILYLFFDSVSYYEPSLYDARYIFNAEEDSFIKDKKVRFFKKMGATFENYDDFINSEDGKKRLDDVKRALEIISELDIEYKEFSIQFDEVKILIEKSRTVKDRLHEQAKKELAESLKEYLSKEDQEKMTGDYRVQDLKGLGIIIPYNLENETLIEYFGTKALSKLEDPKVSEYTKNQILNNQEMYFRKMGLLEEGIPFSVFKESDVCISNTPNKESVDFIESQRKKAFKKFNKEYLIETSSYSKDMEIIQSLNLIGNDPYSINMFAKENFTAMINSAARKNGDVAESVPLLIYNPYTVTEEYSDVFLVHEVNHVIELELLGIDSQKIYHKCGFEYLEDDIETKEDDPEKDDKRPFELFNEVINQLIAMEVTKSMHDDNVYIADEPEKAKIEGNTTYERYSGLVKNFYELFKKEILLARTSKSLQPIFDSFGEENFNKLNDIINEYAEIPFYDMMHDIYHKQDTELVRKRFALFQRAADLTKGFEENKERVI